MGLSTNKKLSRGNATIDCRSVRVDGIGSHWFITRTHVQGRIRRLVPFLEYSTHEHACELSGTLEHLLDGVNRQPTKMRVKLSVVRFQRNDKIRSGLYCLMVKNVTCTISTVDNEVDDAIREENLLQLVLWEMVHFALFLVKISINFSPSYSTVFFFHHSVRLYCTKISKF
jgi:hypothetical protein